MSRVQNFGTSRKQCIKDSLKLPPSEIPGKHFILNTESLKNFFVVIIDKLGLNFYFFHFVVFCFLILVILVILVISDNSSKKESCYENSKFSAIFATFPRGGKSFPQWVIVFWKAEILSFPMRYVTSFVLKKMVWVRGTMKFLRV